AQDPAIGTVLVAEAVLQDIVRCRAFYVGSQGGHRPVVIVGMQSLFPLARLGGGLVLVVAEHGAEPLPVPDRIRAQVPVPQPIRRTSDRQLEALAALAQLLLGSLARGDVAEDDHAAAERPLFPAQRSSVDAQYDTLRLLFITDDYLGLIDLLAAYGSDQGQFHRPNGRDPIGEVAAEMFR